MRKIYTLVSVIVICFLFSSCQKKQINNLTNIGYGTSFGKCVGYCKKNLEITDSKLSFTKTTNDGKMPEKNCTKIFNAQDFNSLKALLNASNIATLNEVIGCPDCADGGAEWVSTNIEGKLYKVTFEYGKAPKELEALVAKLRLLKDGFKDCE